jgi:elongation factor 1-beta
MGFGNLKGDGLNVLNDYLVDKSYIEGWTLSQGDVVVFKALSGPPKADLVHALRWYRQIDSYSKDEQSSWPGVAKPLDQYGPSGTPANDKGGDDDDDDDFDLFGSDDEADVRV